MLIHNVYFWLRRDLSAAERATFEGEARRLTKLAYLAHGWVGTPAATEKRPVTDHSFDYALSLHFNTLAGHDFYQKECPDHARFVSQCKPFWERVVIYDIAPLG